MSDLARVRLFCLVIILALAGCDSSDPDTGTVEVTTVSIGAGLDTDGYTVEVVGTGTEEIGINATATLDEVPAGDVEVRLTRVRGNCTIQGHHPRLVRVVAGETFHTQFDVVCSHTPLLGRIVFSSTRGGNHDLYSMNADGSDVVQLTHLPEGERASFPAVSPDGRRILWINRIGPEDDFSTHYLYVVNADGTAPEQLAPLDGGVIHAPVWSPDGSQIAFSGVIDDNGFEIWVMNADGTELRNLTRTPDAGEFHPSWFPDGRRILFGAGEDEGRLEVITPEGTGRAPFPGAGISWAAWSPDGARIAFLGEGNRLFTMSADGLDPEPLTPDDGGGDLIASWSPDSDRLAYIRIDSDADVYVINADGTGSVNLSDNETFESLGPQAWGP